MALSAWILAKTNAVHFYLIPGRAAVELYFGRNFGWFSLGLGQSRLVGCLSLCCNSFLHVCFLGNVCF